MAGFDDRRHLIDRLWSHQSQSGHLSYRSSLDLTTYISQLRQQFSEVASVPIVTITRLSIPSFSALGLRLEPETHFWFAHLADGPTMSSQRGRRSSISLGWKVLPLCYREDFFVSASTPQAPQNTDGYMKMAFACACYLCPSSSSPLSRSLGSLLS
ncbi:unnamed protein product [Sphagnum balticum]